MDIGQSSATAFNVGVAVSIVATVLSLGMSLTPTQIVAPLRRYGLVAAVIGVNLLFVPAIAVGVADLLELSRDQANGVAFVAIGSGGAAGLKAAQLSGRADMALALSFVIALQLSNLVAVPIWSDLVVAGASIDALTILRGLFVLVVVPMVFGLLVRSSHQRSADRLMPLLVRIANLALAVAVVGGIAANREVIAELLASRVVLASLVITATGVAVGALVGRSQSADSVAIGLISGTRFTALGLVIIGTELDGDPGVLGPAIVFALVDLLVAVGIALVLARRAASVRSAPSFPD